MDREPEHASRCRRWARARTLSASLVAARAHLPVSRCKRLEHDHDSASTFPSPRGDQQITGMIRIPPRPTWPRSRGWTHLRLSRSPTATRSSARSAVAEWRPSTLAEERKHGRQVALKVLRPELGTTFEVDRFLREIAIAARLSHPHLVPLIDSGENGRSALLRFGVHHRRVVARPSRS